MPIKASAEKYDFACHSPTKICCAKKYVRANDKDISVRFFMVLKCLLCLSDSARPMQAISMHPAENVLIGDSATIIGGVAPISISKVYNLMKFWFTWGIAKSDTLVILLLLGRV